MTQRRVRLADVAAHSGVSVATVSCVLSGNREDRFHPDTIERVLRSATELGYVRNQLAGSLKEGRTRTIALFYSPPMDRFVERYQLRVNTLLRQRDCTLVAIPVGANDPQLLLQALSSGMYDGALIACDEPTTQRQIRQMPRPPIPTLILGLHGPLEHYDTVYTGEEEAIHTVLNHLTDSGATRIGFASQFTDTEQTYTSRRWKAYENFQTTRGFTTQLLVNTGGSIPLAFQRGLELFRTITDLPDAIYCDADRVGIGLVMAAQYHGIEIPRTLQIVGTGASTESAHIHPKLTTIGLADESIDAAAHQLLDRLDSPTRPPRASHQHWRVFHRETTNPPHRLHLTRDETPTHRQP